MEEIRTQRRFGVTSKLTTAAQRELFILRQQDGWPVLLDVMEMVCIEMEGDLINTPPEEEAAILAKHKMSRAAWQLFEHLQAKVDDEISRFIYGTPPEAPEDLRSDEEREVENIVNPINYLTADAITETEIAGG